jgi:hypothetical protein
MRKVIRTLNGRIGGVLLCLFLAGSLGGIALAAPGAHTNGSEPQGQAGLNRGDAESRAHTTTDCTAGLKDIHDVLPPEDQATGLAHAIQVVEGNCENNLEAPGLMVALGHLATNYQRHLAHEADENTGEHANPSDDVHSDSGGRSGLDHPSSEDGRD